MNKYDTLEEIIKQRCSIRKFSEKYPSEEDIKKIIESGVYAPYAGAVGMPLNELRKFYIFKQGSENFYK